jgi:hypothetical protein
VAALCGNPAVQLDVISDPILIDTSAPAIVAMSGLAVLSLAEGQTGQLSLNLYVTASDSESAVKSAQVAVGTRPYTTDILLWSEMELVRLFFVQHDLFSVSLHFSCPPIFLEDAPPYCSSPWLQSLSGDEVTATLNATSTMADTQHWSLSVLMLSADLGSGTRDMAGAALRHQWKSQVHFMGSGTLPSGEYVCSPPVI